jgi:hypothetical protein
MSRKDLHHLYLLLGGLDGRRGHFDTHRRKEYLLRDLTLSGPELLESNNLGT